MTEREFARKVDIKKIARSGMFDNHEKVIGWKEFEKTRMWDQNTVNYGFVYDMKRINEYRKVPRSILRSYKKLIT